MSSETFRVDAAREADLPAIMELEESGFDAAIREDEAVFRAKLALFPAGFVVLREAATGRARGYLCAERWADEPGADPAAFRLGHDPAERHAPAGRVVYLASMTLDPGLRGTGLGARLFDEGREHIRRSAPGLETELLLVNEAWEGARRIYERSGFRERSRLAGFFPHEGADSRAAILMARPIDY